MREADQGEWRHENLDACSDIVVTYTATTRTVEYLLGSSDVSNAARDKQGDRRNDVSMGRRTKQHRTK